MPAQSAVVRGDGLALRHFCQKDGLSGNSAVILVIELNHRP